MADAGFDPYHRWLGVRCPNPPPDHFRLLGIERNETDPNVIDEAADRQMSHVRKHQSGPHAEAAARLLSEITLARNCLLDAAKREAYARRLAAPDLPVAAPLAAAPPPAFAVEPIQRATPKSNRTALWIMGALIGGAAVFCLVVVGILYAVGAARSQATAGNTADNNANRDRRPTSPASDSTRPIVLVKPAATVDPPIESASVAPADDAPPTSTAEPQHEPPSPEDKDPEFPSPDDLVVDESPPVEVALAPDVRPPAASGETKIAQVAQLAQHNGPVRSVAFSPDGKYIATAGDDKMCYLLQPPDLKLLHRIENFVPPSSVAFRPFNDDLHLVIAGRRDPEENSGVTFWGLRDAKFLGKLYDCNFDVPYVAVSGDGKRLAVTMGDSAARLYFLATRGRTGLESPRKDYPCRAVAFAPDSHYLLQASGPQVAKWHFDEAQNGSAGLIAQGSGSFINCLAASPDGKLVLTGHDDGVLRITSFTSGKILSDLRGHRGAVTSLTVAVEKPLAASAGVDGRILVWDMSAGKQLAELTGHEGIVHSVAFSPAGRYIVSGGADKTVRLWDLEHPADEAPSATPSHPVAPLARGDLPVPAAKELGAARSLIREVFKDDYAGADSPDAKSLLAKTLLKHASTTKDDVERYALIAEAGRLAMDAGDPSTAMAAATRIAELYDVDGTRLLAKMVQGLTDTVKTTESRVELTNIALRLADDAAARDEHEVAVGLAQLAQQAASGARDGRLLRAARLRHQQAVDEQQAWTAYQSAVATLKDDKTNAAASTVAGKYLCLVRKDWSAGLLLLSAGDDAALSAVARLDLSAPQTGDQRLALAEQWREIAKRVDENRRRPYLARAVHWYQLAAPDLTTLGKLKAQKAIEEIDAELGKSE